LPGRHAYLKIVAPSRLNFTEFPMHRLQERDKLFLGCRLVETFIGSSIYRLILLRIQL
jgi:hypothetical protein